MVGVPGWPTRAQGDGGGTDKEQKAFTSLLAFACLSVLTPLSSGPQHTSPPQRTYLESGTPLALSSSPHIAPDSKLSNLPFSAGPLP